MRESEIFWALAKTVSDETLVLKESAGPGINLTDAENGEFEIDLVPADSESLLGTFYHEAEVHDLDGNETTIFTGQVTIKETAI
ncbi:hypothetical protein [Halonotius roseus]|uniref:Uncharacterized protein n=1 Tax=Halonotius roseus TaxID=2511997 RepID=A0A544QQZ9_9EURY|nr:hypothetical protein [Halonotius roseus]TQQ81864.1 hypothetical protein EWF95_02700 [Halonotius roseus]